MGGVIRGTGWGSATTDEIDRIQKETFHPVKLWAHGMWALICLSPWICLAIWGLGHLVGLA